ncbi:G5 domain-containing protein [Phytohabitans houttuyneae]|jgi:hypothetical protein|uniref:G5 domain-containing protein n=1 Tax=Phytohabitans houttuyneae TaxID=1076126 RepID=A0A6V8JZH7_9ACTN|nr:G5 domain-containing protein [Phytohabitans houttuyneae]GFJ76710.1 hypothetical protein Phou_008900 [Phytohabitans houttuyneae]
MRVQKVLIRVAAAVCVAGLSFACAPADREQVAAETDVTAVEETPSAEPTPTAEATPTPTPTPEVTPTPAVEVKTVTVTQAVPFRRTTVKDSTLTEGTRRVRTKGVAGVKTLTYEVTYTDGKETARKLVSQAVTKQPVTEVVVVGTKKKAPTRQCDPNYSGCVPIASDVDCAGGSGNGPAYVSGPIRVTGSDIYGLDSDDDGIACE